MHRDQIQCPPCDHVACKRKIRRNIVPHGERKGKSRVYNLGCSNAFALPPQTPNQGPLTCGPFTRQPFSPCGASHGHLRGPAWPPATCPRHLRLAWAMRGPATWPQCHVESVLWSRAPHQLRTPGQRSCHVSSTGSVE